MFHLLVIGNEDSLRINMSVFAHNIGMQYGHNHNSKEAKGMDS